MGIRYYLHAGISGSGSTAYIAAYRDLRLPADVHGHARPAGDSAALYDCHADLRVQKDEGATPSALCCGRRFYSSWNACGRSAALLLRIISDKYI